MRKPFRPPAPRLIRPALVFTLSWLVSGCGEELIRATSTRAFADGYEDGCKTGSAAASNLTGRSSRDEKRYDHDLEYAKGWDDGQRACNGGDVVDNPNHPLEPISIEGPDYSGMQPLPPEGDDIEY